MVTGILPFDQLKDGRGYMIKNIKKAEYSQLSTSFSESLRNLITGMLTADPNKRLTAEECIAHEWFEEIK